MQVAVLRLLKQLSQVYSVMKIDRLKQLIPFLNFGQVEALIVDAVKNEYMQVSNPAAGPYNFLLQILVVAFCPCLVPPAEASFQQEAAGVPEAVTGHAPCWWKVEV